MYTIKPLVSCLILSVLWGCGVPLSALPLALQASCKPGGGKLQLLLLTQRVAFDCKGTCVAKLQPLRIVNCADHPIAITSIRQTVFEIPKSNDYQLVSTWSFENKVIAEHRSFAFRYRLNLSKQRQGIALQVTTKEGEQIRLVSPAITTYNLAERRCRRCDGIWRGSYCNCKTPDAGKICFDGSECQGSCLHTGFVVTRPGRCLPRPGANSIRFPMGYRIGRCSAYRFRRKGECRYIRRTNQPRRPELLCRIAVARNCGGCVVSATFYRNPWRFHKAMLQHHLPPHHNNPITSPKQPK